MHNGQIGGYEKIRRALDARIPDDVYNARVGTTDSEAFFYLLFAHGLEADPVGALGRTVAVVIETMRSAGIDEPFRMTAALTDGATLYALRYATDPDPPTLYPVCGAEKLMVVSEPLDADETSWTPVANSHVLTAANGAAPRVRAFRAN